MSNIKYGYYRTHESSVSLNNKYSQQFKKNKCERVYSQSSEYGLSNLEKIKKLNLEKCDILVVPSTTHLGSSIFELEDIIDYLLKKINKIIFLKERIEIKKGSYFIKHLGILTSYDKQIKTDSVRVGMRNSEQELGRPKKYTEEILNKIKELTKKRTPVIDIATELNMPTSTVYLLRRQYINIV